jgi:hypothetical protein
MVEIGPKGLLALLFQIIEGPAAWEVCGVGKGQCGGIQEAVP